MTDQKDKKERAKSGSALSPEDKALWEKVAGSTVPLKKDQADHISLSDEFRTLMSDEADPSERTEANVTGDAATPKNVKASTNQQQQPAFVNLDRRQLRKLTSGQEEIEARLDLHGLTQSEAHNALISFLKSAHQHEKRLVLVITGKGRTKSNNDDPFWQMQEEPGVLKRVLPQWLQEPDLRPIVISFSQAHVRHGGEGAFYIRLRKTRSA